MSDDLSGRPRPWRVLSREVSPWVRPIYAVRWVVARFAYELQRSPFLALAKLVATFALPFGAFTYCWEAKDRHRERIYRTWEVVAKGQAENAGPARFEA